MRHEVIGKICLWAGVVESDPGLGAQLAAALDAGLRAEAAIDGDEFQQFATLAPVEPNEPLALSTHICLQVPDLLSGTHTKQYKNSA